MSTFARKALKAQEALSSMYRSYSDRGVFDLDAFTAIQKQLDDIVAEAAGYVNTLTYPNPCAEILLRTTRPDND